MNKLPENMITPKSVAVDHSGATAPNLPAASAHSYICDMLKELTGIADQAELKELKALLCVTTTAAQTHERFL